MKEVYKNHKKNEKYMGKEMERDIDAISSSLLDFCILNNYL